MSLVLRTRNFWCAFVLLCTCCSVTIAQVPTSLPALQPREVEATERIDAVLAKPVTMNFVDTPLRDIAQFIADETGLPITLTKKIEDAGVQPDQPVTTSARNISLESFLNKMLADINLTIIVKNETLNITTIEDAQSPENMVTKVYPVADLVRTPDGQYDFDPLIDLITSTIEPDSWQDVGGPGSINGYYDAASLVFSQRRDIHQQIEALLTTLRRVKRVQGISTPLALTTTADVPLSRSLKYTRRSGQSFHFSSSTPAVQSRMGGGGLFSVANPSAKPNSSDSPRPTQPWHLPQVYRSAE